MKARTFYAERDKVIQSVRFAVRYGNMTQDFLEKAVVASQKASCHQKVRHTEMETAAEALTRTPKVMPYMCVNCNAIHLGNDPKWLKKARVKLK